MCAIARERCIEIEAHNLTHGDAPESYRSLSKNSSVGIFCLITDSFLLVLAVGGRTALLIARRKGAMNRSRGAENVLPLSAAKPVDGRRTKGRLEALSGRFFDALGIVFLDFRCAFTIASANKRSRDSQTVRD